VNHHRLQACAALIVVVLAACGAPKPESRPATAQQLTPPPQGRKVLPAEAYAVAWDAITLPPRMTPGQKLDLDVTFENTSPVTWPGGSGVLYTVRLGHRWLRGGQLALDIERGGTELPAVVEPGQSVTVRAHVTAPGAPGSYQLQVDMVHEGVAWFADKGAERKLFDVEVR
jgi:hypothetical protein